MTLAERMVVWTLAKGISGGQAGETRRVFDERYAAKPEEWRRDIWRQAAERAETMKVSR